MEQKYFATVKEKDGVKEIINGVNVNFDGYYIFPTKREAEVQVDCWDFLQEDGCKVYVQEFTLNEVLEK